MKRNRKSFPFIIIFTLVFLGALFIRILLVNWTLNFWNNGDLSRYEDWARVAHTYGLADTYKGAHATTVVNNEPPGTLYVLSATYETYIVFGKIIAHATHTPAGSINWVNTFLQHITMKTLPMMADLLTGFLIYFIVKGMADNKKGLLAASFFLFNPIVFYNSAIWGQMDSVNNFFFILSLFFAFRKNSILSILAFTASLYTKLSLLPLLPFYLVFLYFQNRNHLGKLLLGTVLSIIAVVVATFPISSNPIIWLITYIPPLSGGELQNVTNAAFNFWWVATCIPTICHNNIPLISQNFLWISLGTWGYIIFGLLTAPLLYLQIKRPKKFTKPINIVLIFALVALCTFLFLPKMHDRYMYPFFPLFAIVLGLSKQIKKLLIIFIPLCLLHLSNLIYSWYPTYFPTFVFYQILYNDFFRCGVSFATVIIFTWLYIGSMKIFLKEEK